jgi:sporulation protein YlmC with PRC-barrel domain
MKKLNALALGVLVIPAFALATATLAQQADNVQPQQGAAKDAVQSYRPTAEDLGKGPHIVEIPDPGDAGQDQGTGAGFNLSSAPENTIHVEELLGSELRSKSDDEKIGSVSDLIVDEDGQVVAVLVDLGDDSGMGKKDVAIGWGSVQASLNESGDSRVLYVNQSKDGLKDAPAYRTN